MASLPIDLESLLAPLATGDDGAGVDLRGDYSPTSVYQRLRDARAEARAGERRRDRGFDGEEGRAEADRDFIESWRTVLTLGEQVLAETAKDFEVAAWLTEALVRIHGFEGLEAGAGLITGLCRDFWESGFPQPDDEGLEGRALPLGGLSGAGADGTIMQPLRMQPLFFRGDRTPVTFYMISRAVQIASLGDDDRAKALSAPGAVGLSALAEEAGRDRDTVQYCAAVVANCSAAWRSMDAALTERFGRDAPSTRNVTVMLEQIGDAIRQLGGAVAEPAAEAAPAEQGGPISAAAPAVAAAATGAIRTREDALRELNKIADYFRRTEPHSPLAYTLEEAVRRGRMTLAELLQEVLPNDEARQTMLARLGMRSEQT
ncbi:type VI secretion protein [Alsobacter metallidurans]|uniref:Type VI secretion protein n=1 Tax=Alsobacter metallidurans TaxID=340221 RepID=A0A917I6Q4_9HYPH|nr:type VI secretion system protein TssA [Alsobacter metallidurans]GGH20218.1 type VI secretion protein [Alsobacter metallidurans]